MENKPKNHKNNKDIVSDSESSLNSSQERSLKNVVKHKLINKIFKDHHFFKRLKEEYGDHEEPDTFPCPHKPCNKDYKRQSSLDKHISKAHN